MDDDKTDSCIVNRQGLAREHKQHVVSLAVVDGITVVFNLIVISVLDVELVLSHSLKGLAVEDHRVCEDMTLISFDSLFGNISTCEQHCKPEATPSCDFPWRSYRLNLTVEPNRHLVGPNEDLKQSKLGHIPDRVVRQYRHSSLHSIDLRTQLLDKNGLILGKAAREHATVGNNRHCEKVCCLGFSTENSWTCELSAV